MTRRAARRVVLASLAIVCAAYFARHALFAGFGRFLIIDDGPGLADIAVVLAGDSAGDRILTAAALWKKGLIGKVYVSGPPGMYEINEADAAIQFALRRGFPAEAFVAAKNDARSTAEEADRLLILLRAQPGRRLSVVTGNFHTRRAARIWRAKATGFEVRIVAAPSRYQPDSWWTDRENQKIFLIEWQKTVAAWVGL